MPLLEVCVESAAGAADALTAGADRIELCASLDQGGLTPQLPVLREALANARSPVHAMIRPRAGDFCYTDAEYEQMRTEVRAAREAGAHGVVLGILTANGAVDAERTGALIRLARPKSVTFHRAFDSAADPLAALDCILALGVDRLLTSGQEPTAWEGRALIRELAGRAAGRLIVMAGGGVRADHAEALLAETGVTELHASVAFRLQPARP